MRDLKILLSQTRYSLTALTRNGRAMVFSVVFPIVLLVLFNSVFASGDNKYTHLTTGARILTAAYFTAGMAAYAIMQQTFSSLLISLTTQRETGQLKRLRGTPMPSWTFVASLILRSILLVLVMLIVLFVIGAAAFDVRFHSEGIVGLVVYAALGTAALSSLGVAFTIFARSPDVASTLGPFGAVLLSFISGVFVPVSALPDWLVQVGRVFPLYHLAEGMQRCLVGTGTGLSGTNVAVLAVWGFGGLIVAARGFRWEPQAATG